MLQLPRDPRLGPSDPPVPRPAHAAREDHHQPLYQSSSQPPPYQSLHQPLQQQPAHLSHQHMARSSDMLYLRYESAPSHAQYSTAPPRSTVLSMTAVDGPSASLTLHDMPQYQAWSQHPQPPPTASWNQISHDLHHDSDWNRYYYGGRHDGGVLRDCDTGMNRCVDRDYGNHADRHGAGAVQHVDLSGDKRRGRDGERSHDRNRDAGFDIGRSMNHDLGRDPHRDRDRDMGRGRDQRLDRDIGRGRDMVRDWDRDRDRDWDRDRERRRDYDRSRDRDRDRDRAADRDRSRGQHCDRDRDRSRDQYRDRDRDHDRGRDLFADRDRDYHRTSRGRDHKATSGACTIQHGSDSNVMQDNNCDNAAVPAMTVADSSIVGAVSSDGMLDTIQTVNCSDVNVTADNVCNTGGQANFSNDSADTGCLRAWMVAMNGVFQNNSAALTVMQQRCAMAQTPPSTTHVVPRLSADDLGARYQQCVSWIQLLDDPASLPSLTAATITTPGQEASVTVTAMRDAMADSYRCCLKLEQLRGAASIHTLSQQDSSASVSGNDKMQLAMELAIVHVLSEAAACQERIMTLQRDYTTTAVGGADPGIKAHTDYATSSTASAVTSSTAAIATSTLASTLVTPTTTTTSSMLAPAVSSDEVPGWTPSTPVRLTATTASAAAITPPRKPASKDDCARAASSVPMASLSTCIATEKPATPSRTEGGADLSSVVLPSPFGSVLPGPVGSTGGCQLDPARRHFKCLQLSTEHGRPQDDDVIRIDINSDDEECERVCELSRLMQEVEANARYIRRKQLREAQMSASGLPVTGPSAAEAVQQTCEHPALYPSPARPAVQNDLHAPTSTIQPGSRTARTLLAPKVASAIAALAPSRALSSNVAATTQGPPPLSSPASAPAATSSIATAAALPQNPAVSTLAPGKAASYKLAALCAVALGDSSSMEASADDKDCAHAGTRPHPAGQMEQSKPSSAQSTKPQTSTFEIAAHFNMRFPKRHRTSNYVGPYPGYTSSDFMRGCLLATYKAQPHAYVTYRAYSRKVPASFTEAYEILRSRAPFPAAVYMRPPTESNRVAVVVATHHVRGATTLIGAMSLYAGTDERERPGAYEIWDTAVLPEMYDVPEKYGVASVSGPYVPSVEAQLQRSQSGLQSFDVTWGLIGLLRLLFGNDISLVTAPSYTEPFTLAGFDVMPSPCPETTALGVTDVHMRLDDNLLLTRLQARLASATRMEPSTLQLLTELRHRAGAVVHSKSS